MKHKIEINLPTVPYDHNLRDIIAYIQSAVSELTGTMPQVFINDFDFTSVSGAYKQQRKPSFPNRILRDEDL